MAPRASQAATLPMPVEPDCGAADELIEALEYDEDEDDEDEGEQVGADAAIPLLADPTSSRFKQVANEDAEVMELADGDDMRQWPAFRLGPTLPAKVPGTRFDEPTVPLPPEGPPTHRKRPASPTPWVVLFGSAGALAGVVLIGAVLVMVTVGGVGLAWRAGTNEPVTIPATPRDVGLEPPSASPTPSVEVAETPSEPAVEVVVEAPVVRPAARRAPKPAPAEAAAPAPVVEAAPAPPPPVAAEAPAPPPKRGLFKRKKDE